MFRRQDQTSKNEHSLCRNQETVGLCSNLLLHTSNSPSIPIVQNGSLTLFLAVRYSMECNTPKVYPRCPIASQANAKQRPTNSIYALCAVLESIVTVMSSVNVVSRYRVKVRLTVGYNNSPHSSQRVPPRTPPPPPYSNAT